MNNHETKETDSVKGWKNVILCLKQQMNFFNKSIVRSSEHERSQCIYFSQDDGVFS